MSIDSETLRSELPDRYYLWAALAVVAGFLACIYLLYCYYQNFLGRPAGLEHLSVRIFLGLVGAVAAFGGIPLSGAMWTHWREHDRASEASKRFWYSMMTFVPLFGSTVYYFAVFRRRNVGHA